MSSHPPTRNVVRDDVSPPSPLLGPSIPIDGSPEDSMLTKNYAYRQIQKKLMERDRCQLTIDILPDDILLCIFSAYLKGPYGVEVWLTLVHVCRRWRTIVFESPRHLNLRLSCSVGTPVPGKLDIWPALPIVVQYRCHGLKRNLDNLIEAIKHNDRVCKIQIHTFVDKSQLEEVVSVMQVPFPALTDLELVFNEEEYVDEMFSRYRVFKTPMFISESFLGGSAPRLQRLYLQGISFPGLPKLLLSTTDLISIQLRDLPNSCYISPDAIVTCLSASARLKSFTLKYESPQFPQDWESRHLRPVPPSTRTLLPALTLLRVKGFPEYVEDLISRIDTPLLHRLHITIFNETGTNLPYISQLINHIPKFQELDDARVSFSDDEVRVTLSLPIGTIGFEGLVLKTSWDGSVGLLEIVDRLCGPLLPTLSMVEQLYMYGEEPLGMSWSEGPGMQPSHWLELLHSFTGARDLYLSEDLAPCILPALEQLVGERTTEVLPALKNLFIYRDDHWYQRPVREEIEKFVAARQLSGHPINISVGPVGSIQWSI